jgi:hypothetical protein
MKQVVSVAEHQPERPCRTRRIQISVRSDFHLPRMTGKRAAAPKRLDRLHDARRIRGASAVPTRSVWARPVERSRGRLRVATKSARCAANAFRIVRGQVFTCRARMLSLSRDPEVRYPRKNAGPIDLSLPVELNSGVPFRVYAAASAPPCC